MLVAAVLVSLAGLIVWHPRLADAISQEDGPLEMVQVALFGATGAIALSSAVALRRAGRSVMLDALIVAAMGGLVIGEIDLDRQIFGVKVIHTRFLMNEQIAIPLRVLAAIVVVGVPAALGLWMVVRWRTLWRATLAALREPWGQVFAGGAVMFAIAEIFEKPLARATFAPRNSLEESLELAAAIAFFLAVVVRRLALGRRS